MKKFWSTLQISNQSGEGHNSTGEPPCAPNWAGSCCLRSPPPPPGCLRSVPATTQAPAAGPRSQLCAQPHLQTPLSPVSVRNSWTCRHSRHFLRALRGHVVTAECNTATLTQDHTAVEAMDRGHLSPRDIIPHWAQSRHAPALGALHSG